jgi:hypothetical protein
MARQKGSRTGRCQGCNHLERVRIERLLAAGASIKGAARKFAIGLSRLASALEEPCFGRSPRGVHRGRRGDQRSARRDRRRLLAGRLHENFRDCGRLTGELQRGPLLNVQNNILVNPDYATAIARIVSAVAPYPEAREAVIAALRDLDAASASAPALMDRRSAGAVVDG